MNQQADFLNQLQQQAKKQAKLHQQRFLPEKLDGISSFVGNYPWQVISLLAGLTALFLELS